MENFDFNDWLSGVETPAETVTIFEKPLLVGAIHDLKEELAATPPNTDRAIGDPDVHGDLQKRIAALSEELAASKATFYVSAVSPEDDAAIFRAHPDPAKTVVFDEKPPRLGANATEAQSQAYLKAWAAFETRQQMWLEEHAQELEEWRIAAQEVAAKRGAERLARAITYIRRAGQEEKQRVNLSADNIQALQHKIGQPQMGLLVEALERVSSQVPEDPDPFG